MKITAGTKEKKPTPVTAKEIPLGRLAKVVSEGDGNRPYVAHLRIRDGLVRLTNGDVPSYFLLSTYSSLDLFEVLPEDFTVTLGGK